MCQHTKCAKPCGNLLIFLLVGLSSRLKLVLIFLFGKKVWISSVRFNVVTRLEERKKTS
jgi:hypothetical protein